MRKLSLSSLLLLSLCIFGCGGSEAPPAGSAENSAGEASPGEAPGASDESSGMSSTPAKSTEAPPEGEKPVPAATGAQTASATGSTLNYIPDDAVAVIRFRPSKVFGNPLVKELIQTIDSFGAERPVAEQMKSFEDEVGVNLNQVDHVMMVIDQQVFEMNPLMMMMGIGANSKNDFADVAANSLHSNNVDVESPVVGDTKSVVMMQAPPGGMMQPPKPLVVIQLREGVDKQSILDSVPNGQTIEIAGGSGVTTPDGGVLFSVSESRLVYSPQHKLEATLKNSSASKIRTMLEKSDANDLAVAVDLDPVKQLVQKLMQRNPNPAMSLFMPILSQMNTLTLVADLEAANLLQVNVATPNTDAAQGVQASLTGFLNMGKQQYQAAKGDVPAEMQSLAQQIVDGAELSASETVVSLTVPRPADFNQLPELLKPAFEKAASAAMQARKRNDMKQVGLAFHNYHDTYRHFPAADSNGEDADNVSGKGLSWRVHLLPFLEEAVLYEKFKMDEPWDSEHNKALIQEMPKLFGENPEGKTTLHVFVGEGLAFNEGQPGPRIRDYTDGTSNTLLVVKAGDDAAEIWTKPGGIKFDAEDPLKPLGKVGEFISVLFCDGSVRDLPADLDKETWSNLINQKDGNPVQF